MRRILNEKFNPRLESLMDYQTSEEAKKEIYKKLAVNYELKGDADTAQKYYARISPESDVEDALLDAQNK